MNNFSIDNLNISTELILASLYGQLETVKEIVQSSDIDVNLCVDICRMNPLIAAAKNGNLDIVKYLLTSSDLKNPINIHATDIDGWDALINACKYEHLEVMKYLLTSNEIKENSNLYVKIPNYQNIFIMYLYFKKYNIVDFLLFDMNMKIDEKTLTWLEGKNRKKEVYNEIIEKIQIRDFKNTLDLNLQPKTLPIKKRKI